MTDDEKTLAPDNGVPAQIGAMSDEAKMKETQRELLFGDLRSNMNVSQTKNIIQKNVPERWQSSVFHCIWFFSTTLPDVAQQLLQYVETNNIDGYMQLAYGSISEAIKLRLLKTYHINGTTATPGKQQIEDMIEDIQDKKELADSMKPYIRWSGPTVAVWLLPVDWIDINNI